MIDVDLKGATLCCVAAGRYAQITFQRDGVKGEILLNVFEAQQLYVTLGAVIREVRDAMVEELI